MFRVMLFAVVGRMVYDRAHTRDLGELERLQLHSVLPFAAVTFVLAGFASMGMPGFSGFIAELNVLLGAWKVFPSLALVAGAGILVGVVYTLRVMHRTFFAVASGEVEVNEIAVRELTRAENSEAITVPERFGAVILIGLSLALGLYPGLLLDWILPALAGPLFDGLRKSGGGE